MRVSSSWSCKAQLVQSRALLQLLAAGACMAPVERRGDNLRARTRRRAQWRQAQSKNSASSSVETSSEQELSKAVERAPGFKSHNRCSRYFACLVLVAAVGPAQASGSISVYVCWQRAGCHVRSCDNIFPDLKGLPRTPPHVFWLKAISPPF